jgi:hypothetical protein
MRKTIQEKTITHPALLPAVSITFDDLELIPFWLNDPFNRGIVAHVIDEGLLTLYLSSSFPENWEKALVVLRHCMAIRWLPVKESSGEAKPFPVVDDFWLKEIIQHHARNAGVKTGENAANVFAERVKEIFGSKTYHFPSRLYRPAIEDHAQNHDMDSAENRSIEGLREALLGWAIQSPREAEPYIEKLLIDELEIMRRIGIYVIGQIYVHLCLIQG